MFYFSLLKPFYGDGVRKPEIKPIKWDWFCYEKEKRWLAIQNLKAFNLFVIEKMVVESKKWEWQYVVKSTKI